MQNKKRVLINVVVSSIAQVITLGLGLILPRVILVSWGSEYNGLINSVTTIMRYLALLEAGVSTSTLQALYKSIGNKDPERTSVIVKTSQTYYRKLSAVYAVIVILISFVYPLFIKTTISYWEIVFVIILQGCTGIINFAFRAAYQQLLNAEGKYYIISLLTLGTTIFTYISKIVAISVYNSVILMQVFGVVVMLIQVMFYSIYFKKKYSWLDKNVTKDFSLLENRKYYLIQQTSGLIFNSTDTIILSIVCGLKIASVYTVYNMVYSALATFVGILRGSTNFVLGQSFHVSKTKFAKIYKEYSSFQTVLGSFLASCSVLLILSFIKLYTRGISDVNYINYFAAILFSLNIILDCSRGASLAGANVAGKAPNTTWRYILEASLNLSISLALVWCLQINGVLLGTVLSGIWRTIDSIVYFHKRILYGKPMKELLFVAINFILFFCFAVIGFVYELPICNYFDFLCCGLVIVIVLGVLYFSIYALYNGIKNVGFLKSLK